MKRIALYMAICLVSAVSLPAQDLWSRITGEVGAGVTLPVGATDDHAGTGFNFVAAVGPRLNARTSLLLDFGYHGMDLDSIRTGGNDTAIDANMRVWSLSLNPAFEYARTDHFNAYVTGGYGVYNRRLELTRADFQRVVVCDDWWGICSGGFVSGEDIIGDRSTYKGGFNVGTGVSFGSSYKFFVEARYHRMFTTNKDTEIVPITFGIRW